MIKHLDWVLFIVILNEDHAGVAPFAKFCASCEYSRAKGPTTLISVDDLVCMGRWQCGWSSTHVLS